METVDVFQRPMNIRTESALRRSTAPRLRLLTRVNRTALLTDYRTDQSYPLSLYFNTCMCTSGWDTKTGGIAWSLTLLPLFRRDEGVLLASFIKFCLDETCGEQNFGDSD